MKRAWLFVVLFFIIQPQFLQGQSVDKGNIYFGAFGTWSNFENAGFSGILVPRFEYLVYDKFSAGSDVGFSYTYLDFPEVRKYSSVIVSPFARYYFLNKKVSPIAEVSYYHAFNFGSFSKTWESTDTNIIFLSVGISTPRLVTNRVGFDLTSGFAWNFFPGGVSRIRFAPITSFRITYGIRKK